MSALSVRNWFLPLSILFMTCVWSSAALSETHTIEIKDFTFQPSSLEVNVGDTVVWINRDYAPHTATATDDSWDTGNLEFKKKAKIKISETTRADYYCRYHPNMKATLIIQNQ